MSTNWGTGGVWIGTAGAACCAPRRSATIAIPNPAPKTHVLRCLPVTPASHGAARNRELLEDLAELVFQVLIVAKGSQFAFGIGGAAGVPIETAQAKVRHDVCRIVLHRALQQRHGFGLTVGGNEDD